MLDARVFIQFKDETFGTKTVEEKLPLSSMWEQPPCNWNNLVKCGMVHEYIKETQSNLFHWEKLSAAYPQQYLYISI